MTRGTRAAWRQNRGGGFRVCACSSPGGPKKCEIIGSGILYGEERLIRYLHTRGATIPNCHRVRSSHHCSARSFCGQRRFSISAPYVKSRPTLTPTGGLPNMANSNSPVSPSGIVVPTPSIRQPSCSTTRESPAVRQLSTRPHDNSHTRPLTTAHRRSERSRAISPSSVFVPIRGTVRARRCSHDRMKVTRLRLTLPWRDRLESRSVNRSAGLVNSRPRASRAGHRFLPFPAAAALADRRPAIAIVPEALDKRPIPIDQAGDVIHLVEHVIELPLDDGRVGAVVVGDPAARQQAIPAIEHGGPLSGSYTQARFDAWHAADRRIARTSAPKDRGMLDGMAIRRAAAVLAGAC